jgi:hypothetical protein
MRPLNQGDDQLRETIEVTEPFLQPRRQALGILREVE